MIPIERTPSQWPGTDERQFIAEMLASGSSDAWAACLAYVSRRVAIQAREIPRDYWDDITQDVMLLIVRKLPDFRGQSRLSTWIICIVRNCILRFYRDYLFLSSLTDSLSNPSTRKKLHNSQLSRKTTWTLEEEYILRDELRQALAELIRYVKSHPRPHRNAQILEAILFHHKPVPAVAEELNCSVDTIRNVIRSARKYVFQKLLVVARRLARRSVRRTNRSRRKNVFYPL